MQLEPINDQSTWDAFVSAQPWASFQQSWHWGEFQKTQGHLVKRFFFGPALAAQFIYYKRRLSGYWFCPRGPVGEVTRELFHSFLLQLDRTVKPKPFFFRVEPPIETTSAEGLIMLALRRNHAMSPAATVLVDLTKTEEELLEGMHPKTRYNIRVAEKHGIVVREGTSQEERDAFLHLLKETGKRQGFIPHDLDYLRSMFEFLSQKKMARLRLAENKGTVLAANLEITFGDTVTYLHGASSTESKNVMAPFLLHWEAMRCAKRNGYRWYDMWGANAEAKSNYYYKESWEGITRFKRGWGGRTVDLVGTWDLPTNHLLYRFAFLKQWLKG